MDVATMRKADRWLGAPACFLLTRLRRLRDLFRRRRDAPRRILFVKLAEQGSTVLAHSALCRACRRVGRDNVFFLCFEQNRFILDAMRIIPEQNVVTLPADSLPGAIRGAIRAVRRMRREGIDAAVDLEFFARASAALCYLSGATWRVGFHAFAGEASYRGDLMTHRLLYNPHLHTAQVFALMVEALDQDPKMLPAFGLTPPAADEPLPRFEPGKEELEEVRGIVRSALAREADADGPLPPLILLNANCSDLLPLRRWAGANYVALARRLLQRYDGAVVAFTGGPPEAEPVAALVAEVASERCISLAGRTTLRQLLVLYCLSEVLVTNDSGPAHFTALTPIHAVTLFGPETPALFAARTDRNTVIHSGVVCSPCVSAYNDRRTCCTHNVCMQRITVDQVFRQTCLAFDRRAGLP